MGSGEKEATTEAERFHQSQRKRLIKRVIGYLPEIGAHKIRETDVEYIGIRDWGREPYVGAAHSFWPERSLRDVLTTLSAFKLGGAGETKKNILSVPIITSGSIRDEVCRGSVAE